MNNFFQLNIFENLENTVLAEIDTVRDVDAWLIVFEFEDIKFQHQFNMRNNSDFNNELFYTEKDNYSIIQITRYAEKYEYDLIRQALQELNHLKGIQNVYFQVKFGAESRSEFNEFNKICPIDFLLLLTNIPIKHIKIEIEKYLPKDFEKEIKKLAKLLSSVETLNFSIFKSTMPLELIALKDSNPKSVSLEYFNSGKKIPKFLYEFADSLESLELRYNLSKKNTLHEFTKLRSLWIQLEGFDTNKFMINEINQLNLDALKLVYCDALPSFSDDFVSRIKYLSYGEDIELELDELTRYKNLVALEIDESLGYFRETRLPHESKIVKNLGKLLGTKETEEIDMFPTQILELTNLKYLSLACTSTEYLPETIDRLHQLEYIDLMYTDIEELPKNIMNLKHLKYLNIHGTNIKENSILNELRKSGVNVVRTLGELRQDHTYSLLSNKVKKFYLEMLASVKSASKYGIEL